VEEGLFPHENSMSDRDGLEEERRLMYVAITRARQRLYLSYSQTRMLHGQTRFNLKSRFFDELPEEALKWLTPKHSAPAASGFAVAGRGWQGGGFGNQGFDSTRYAAGAAPHLEKEVARKDESVNGLVVKQKVFHPKFGEGTVLTLEGTGDDARAQISFPRHGTKWLALSIAKLTPLP
jgi:DNA helicase-2/ATP-dependent DNA helicase PcrA